MERAAPLIDQAHESAGDVLALISAITTKIAVDEQLQEIKGKKEDPEQRGHCVLAVREHMVEMPVLCPLVERSVLNMPSASADFEHTRVAQPVGNPRDGEAPGVRRAGLLLVDLSLIHI